MTTQTLRQAVRRLRHARAIRNGTFGDNDPIFRQLAQWVKPGTIAVDVGAAVGTYTVTLSDLVGPEGRVVAIEPVPEQFATLTTNCLHLRNRNVTCLQLAAGASTGTCRISAPTERFGMPNWYQAQVSQQGMPVLIAALDDLPIPRPVGFLKVDAEGHDTEVLHGATDILTRDQPILYVEVGRKAREWLGTFGYELIAQDARSANRVLAVTHQATPLT